jgi:acyl-CoA thioesterase-1
MGWARCAAHTCRVRARVVLLVAALVLGITYVAATQALGAGQDRCEQFASDSVERAAQVTGSGQRVVVVGDSWSAGLGLAEPVRSWPSRLRGQVHVAGFSGSGFSAHASPCGPVSFADRAGAVVADADLVVVEGGLNDWDRSDAEVRAGFARLARVLRAADVPRVAVVGPAAAPSRAARVPHVDALLDRLSEQYGFGYVSTADLDLDYLGDRLHLTEAGHRAFGDAVSSRIGDLAS